LTAIWLYNPNPIEKGNRLRAASICIVAYTNFGKANRRLIRQKGTPAFALASVKDAFDIHEMFVDSWSQSSWRILPDINVSVTVIFLTVKPFMVRLIT
tara:strand:+ start:1338 stop:1631 length:294 start_codon:yes stop_codon:yes gene_type:complete